MDEVTNILVYFDNNRHTMTEVELEYKQKMLEKIKNWVRIKSTIYY